MMRIGFFEPLPWMRATRLARAGSRANSFTGMPSRSSTAWMALRGLGLVAGRVAGVDLEQGGEAIQDLGFELLPIHRIAVLSGGGGRQPQKAGKGLHNGIVA